MTGNNRKVNNIENTAKRLVMMRVVEAVKYEE